jgi:hypothetical protein
MALAIERLRSSPRQPVYSELFFLASPYTKFQYPVSSLGPLDLLQRATGLSWPRLFARINAARVSYREQRPVTGRTRVISPIDPPSSCRHRQRQAHPSSFRLMLSF